MQDLKDMDTDENRIISIEEMLQWATVKKKLNGVWLKVASLRDPCIWINTQRHLQWVYDTSSNILKGDRSKIFKQVIKPYFKERYKRDIKMDTFLTEDYVTKFVEERSICIGMLCKHSLLRYPFLKKVCESQGGNGALHQLSFR